MRASDLLGRIVYHDGGEPAGRIVDLVAHADGSGGLYVDAAMVAPGRRGRLLGYERAALQRPWPVRRFAEWLHRGIREVRLSDLRTGPEPDDRSLPDSWATTTTTTDDEEVPEMHTLDELLDEVYSGQERLTRDEIHRRAVAADLPADDLSAIDALPEGEYTQDEAGEAVAQQRGGSARGPDPGVAADADGIAPGELAEEDLLRELASLHRTRHETFLHGSAQALQRHSERTTELELEYLRRHPARDIDTERLRSGARDRS